MSPKTVEPQPQRRAVHACTCVFDRMPVRPDLVADQRLRDESSNPVRRAAGAVPYTMQILRHSRTMPTSSLRRTRQKPRSWMTGRASSRLSSPHDSPSTPTVTCRTRRGPFERLRGENSRSLWDRRYPLRRLPATPRAAIAAGTMRPSPSSSAGRSPTHGLAYTHRDSGAHSPFVARPGELLI
jgi:hypothetical protein